MILAECCVILLNRTIILIHFIHPKKSKDQTFAFGVVGNLLHFTWIILKTSHFVWSTGLPRSIRPLPWSHPQETSHGRRTWVHVEVRFQPCWDPRFLHKLFTGCFFLDDDLSYSKFRCRILGHVCVLSYIAIFLSIALESCGNIP